ncbi:MAG: tRNA pseudouridine(13) synthase TruD [Spirochaetes bacterium]|nr:tRNA pseudouridine(13) synthase TruD [Spirochaetota bacterium]
MKVKASPDDFRVEEESTVELSDRPGPYAVYRLEKTSWDTFDLLDLLARRLGVGRRDLTVAGLKDRHGITSQLVAVRGLKGRPREVREANFSAVPAGWTDSPLSARSIAGNRFSLVLRDMDGPEARRCLEALAVVRRDGAPNYYDEQRFGSARHGEGFMGKELFLGRRERALRLYFTASKYDDRRTREMKRCVLEHCGSWRECLPLARGDYARVLERLVGSPRAFRQALLALDRRLLVFVLNAYQSFLFNEVLAGLVRREALSRGFETRELRYNVGSFAFPVELPDEARASFTGRELPVPGYDTVVGDDDVREVLDAVLAREGIGLPDLRARQLPRISAHGVSRPAWMHPANLEAGEPADDERYPGKLSLALSFSLPRGCYATIVVRRLALATPRPR